MVSELPRDVSLYFHIPFCTRKCDYCHFFVLPDQEEEKEQLLEGFKKELTLVTPQLKGKRILTLYFGGGTPSLFGPFRLASLLELLRTQLEIAPHAEITLEANPENITHGQMQAYAEAGINRVSLGIQTLDGGLLQLLGRLHQPKTALQAVETIYQAGISNISIDLMYDLPTQTLRHWKETLHQIEHLPLSHLSLYNLTLEPQTLFFKKQRQLRPLLPDEETSLAMYEMAIEQLEKRGFAQYEISAFARPGFISQHNMGYWVGRPFLGLGPSAFSDWEGERFRNVAHLGKYCRALEKKESPVDFKEKLEPDARLRERFVLALRLKAGLFLPSFTRQHGPLDRAASLRLEKLISEGFIHQDKERIFLSKRGILFYDTVASELI